MGEVQALRLGRTNVKFVKQQQPLCRLMVQAASTVRLIVASLALTNYGKPND
jgi:hypothetical protein